MANYDNYGEFMRSDLRIKVMARKTALSKLAQKSMSY
jgi:hypothetical protein